MKAEHRKELQTNLLADRMGTFIRNARGGPSRQGVLIFLAVVVLGIGGLVFYFWWTSTQRAAAELWVTFDETTDLKELVEISKEYSQTNPGKAARAQVAWLLLWEFGVKRMGREPTGAMNSIVEAKDMYEKLSADVGDDPVFGPECLYCIAVAEESLASNTKDVQLKHLDSALKAYKEVMSRFDKSAYAGYAEKRVAQLENKDERLRIDQFYMAMQEQFIHFENIHKQEMMMKQLEEITKKMKQ